MVIESLRKFDFPKNYVAKFFLKGIIYYYQNAGASNMSKKISYLPQQNLIKLKKHAN